MRNSLILIGLTLTGILHAGTTVTLREKAVPRGKYLRLQEIADIKGTAAEALGRVYLMPGGENGGSVSRAEVLNRLRALGLADDVTFRGAREVRLTDGESVVAPVAAIPEKPGKAKPYIRKIAKRETLGKTPGRESKNFPARRHGEAAVPVKTEMAVRAAVASLLKKDFEGYDVRGMVDVRRVTLPVEDFAKLEAQQVAFGRIPGKAEITLVAKNADGENLDYGSAEVNVQVEINTPVLTRSLSKGDHLREKDIVWRYEIYTGQLPEKIVAADIAGRECLKNVRSGSHLCMADFAVPDDVTKNGVVLVLTKGLGFEIKERAVALEGGRTGDQIRVQAEYDKKRTYPVRITGRGQAEVVISK